MQGHGTATMLPNSTTAQGEAGDPMPLRNLLYQGATIVAILAFLLAL